MSAIREYLGEVQDKFRTDVAGEHAYRPALQQLLESADARLNAVNDPARTAIGMPDFVVLRQPGNVPIGIVEAKDTGNQLSRTEKTEQIKRYLAHGNLILTDYLEFRWYVNGEKIDTVRIASVKNGKITRISKAYDDLTNLLGRFARQTTQSVNSAQDLADRLARSAHFIAHFIEKDLKSGAPSPNLRNQLAAFQKTLLPDLDIPAFADMYAQTLAYGLFASRVNYPGDPAKFSLRGAAQDIPRTNPFLRDLFYHSSFDLGARLAWLTESLVEILRHTDMDSILAHFGQRTGQSDPVVHFYESFLSAYNPSLRETRGVYYTPEPVVKYIVRSVDHILKSRFDRPRGLADENALILDPAAGTGTFLYFVIERIKEAFAGQQGLWKSYVEKHLLPRIFGFELLMAPYTVAHMNLSLQLKEAGYEFKDRERLGIYLTNSLEEAVEAPELPFAEFISHEVNQAAEIKREKPIMVVLGNPPYSGHSANKGEWIGKLVRDYYFVDGEPIGERNSKWLQDDYVKFIRFGQWRIEQTGEGVLAFITNNSYLDAPTFRGMRQNLMSTFDSIYIVNLHGSVLKRETTPDGNKDENVFDIQQGVAISIFVKESNPNIEVKKIQYMDLWGTRTTKYLELDNIFHGTNAWQEINVGHPYWLFVPIGSDNNVEYEKFPSIKKIFQASSMGIVTARDSLTIHETSESIWNTVTKFVELDTESARELYNLGRDVRDWKVHLAQADIRESGPDQKHILPIAYRPFDIRYTYFTGKSKGFICMPRREIMRNVINRDNLCFLTTRQQVKAGFQHVFCVASPAEFCVISNRSREGNQVFPLYLYPTKQKELTDPDEFPLSHKGRRPNLSKAFVAELEAKLGLPFQTEGGAFLTPPPAPPVGQCLCDPSIGEGSAAIGEASSSYDLPPNALGGPRGVSDEGSAFAGPHPQTPSPRAREGASGHDSAVSLEGDPSSPASSLSATKVPPSVWGRDLGWGQSGASWFGPEDIFYYVYAIFHSPSYRQRYAEFLKIDFPRLPLTADVGLFGELVRYGAQLVSLHLLKSPKLSDFITTFDIEGDNEVARGYPKYVESGGRVYINKTQYVGGVPREIWDFHIGGYQVPHKWLKDRRGRNLSYADLTHYQQIIVALAETRRIMAAIDAAIPGFPLP